jgi:diadenosine tetraphosphate (Ap4A) HIT family hydrolase
MPRDTWRSLVEGVGCPLCASVTTTEDPDHHGYFIADLESGRVRLSLDQLARGYCVLLSRRHVREPYELARPERAAFFEDMCQIGRVVEGLFGAIKMNFQVLGMKTPHLHAHIIPRYYRDRAPGRALLASDGRLELDPPEYLRLVDKIRAALLEGAVTGDVSGG